MIGSTVSTFANTQYKCCECSKNLGDKYLRLKGRKQPNINKINGNIFCDKCANKLYK